MPDRRAVSIDGNSGTAHLERQLATRNRVLETSLAIGQAVSSELDLERLCDVVMDRLMETFTPLALALLFLDDTTGELSVKRHRGPPDVAAEHPQRIKAAKAAATQRRTVVCPPLSGLSDGPPATTAAVPLVAEHKVKGVLALCWVETDERPNAEDLQMLAVLAVQVAAAIDNAWLYGEMQRLNAGLEKKIRQRTAKLHDSNEQLAAALEELRRTQTQLVQDEKMVSLGQLTAGVAHEINNPLAFVLNNVALAQDRVARLALRLEVALTWIEAREGLPLASLMERLRALTDQLGSDPFYHEDLRELRHDLDLALPAPAAELTRDFLRYLRLREENRQPSKELCASLERLLERAREGLERMKNTVLDLRSFARIDEAELQSVDLDESIAKTLALIHHHAENHGVKLSHEPGLTSPCACFPARLNQVILNLVTNAIQATPAGGTVTVVTREGSQGPVIEVRDTGRGIPPEQVQRIFDPFFTTKPVGQGTGLGLSIVYKIIEEHGGSIRVESHHGQGSCFTVELPRRTS